MKTILVAVILFCALLLAVSPAAAAGDTYRLAWDPVTLYTDGTPIAGTVTYSAFWTADPSLAVASLHQLGAGGPVTQQDFDVASAGMTRGAKVYFTATATVDGVPSALAAALAWDVPHRQPSPPGNPRLIKLP